VLEHPLGRADLFELPVVHHRDPVGDAHRLLLVVGHRDGGDSGRLQDAPDLLAHLHPEVDVQVRERLVEQEQPGLGRERPCERDPLLLAPGERLRVLPPVVGQPDEFEQVVDPPLAFGLRAVGQPERDVLAGGEVGEQRELLEHDSDVALLGRLERVTLAPRDGLFLDADGTSGGSFESGDEPERRRLPAARRPQQRQEFPLVDRQREVLDDGRLVVGLVHAVEFEHDVALGGRVGPAWLRLVWLPLGPLPVGRQQVLT
jgi:hypothetical protein